ncbi:hypothetical protein HYDPIDRAFT_114361 [Hydnomerulius pinastri MD-312]|uniref:Uncharacterized protein n=1 Tax=Hydnomerulius pinastri MD-312 TaxID=994086 RepID=A0A0C9WD38_9AGAM|nr:hypothetical protein HYDPIDRAFT_114361 [Hydnomerulius pinastri MD-312]
MGRRSIRHKCRREERSGGPSVPQHDPPHQRRSCPADPLSTNGVRAAPSEPSPQSTDHSSSTHRRTPRPSHPPAPTHRTRQGPHRDPPTKTPGTGEPHQMRPQGPKELTDNSETHAH